LARLRIAGSAGALRVTNFVTLYAALDRLDFDVQIDKPATTNEQRLLHFFPLGDGAKDLHIETTACVLRPRLQPEGDLLPGADTRRFAVQGFVDYAPAGRQGVTIASLDSYMLRLDQDALAFEALGNDQNWKEVTQDQDGVTQFRFRYSLRAHPPGYDNASALAWSRTVAAPLTLAAGTLPAKWLDHSNIEVDPARALVTCLKPADDAAPGKVAVRLWESSGQSSPVTLRIQGYRNAKETDLLERARGPLALKENRISVGVRGHGFAGIELQ